MTIHDDAAAFLAEARSGVPQPAAAVERLADLLHRLLCSAVMEAEDIDDRDRRRSIIYWVTEPLEDLAMAAEAIADQLAGKRNARRNRT